MTQSELFDTVKLYPAHFLTWARHNHGHHKKCDVAYEIRQYDKGKGSIDKILEAVVETEDRDWEESWENFMNDLKL